MDLEAANKQDSVSDGKLLRQLHRPEELKQGIVSHESVDFDPLVNSEKLVLAIDDELINILMIEQSLKTMMISCETKCNG